MKKPKSTSGILGGPIKPPKPLKVKGYGILSSSKSKPPKVKGYGILSSSKSKSKTHESVFSKPGEKSSGFKPPKKKEFQGAGLAEFERDLKALSAIFKSKPQRRRSKQEKESEEETKTIFQAWKEKRDDKKDAKEREIIRKNGYIPSVPGKIVKSAINTSRRGDVTVSMLVKVRDSSDAMELMKSFNQCVKSKP